MIWVRKKFMFAHHIFFFTLSYSSIKPLITPSMSANPMHFLKSFASIKLYTIH